MLHVKHYCGPLPELLLNLNFGKSLLSAIASRELAQSAQMPRGVFISSRRN